MQVGSRGDGDGFTLIELLVVIVILGILSAVVVFAVAGVRDKGQAVAVRADAKTIRTAEEAYCATKGTYGTLADLQAPPAFLASAPTYNSVVVTPGLCGGTGFVIGSTTFSPASGPLFLAASNNTPGFSFLASAFIDANGPIQFSFGASGGLATRANTPADPSVLFASADEGNVNKTIATADPGPVPGGPGTCTTTCLGIGSTKVQYTTGRLVVFSCTSAGRTLAPAAGSPACDQPAGGYLAGPPTTPAGIVAVLNADPASKLAVTDPSTLPPVSPPVAPYGLAAYQALTSTAPGGGGLTDAQFQTLHSSGRIVYGANVTATQTLVVTGNVAMALIPRSFVFSPAGNDTDNWTTVDQALHNPIRQWAVVLNKGSAADRARAQSFLSYLTSAPGRAVLAAFGYDPVT